MNTRKKLIEVSLPLEAINQASAREKSIRQGHPSTLHPWWARRPLAACRAVLFASIVDDPSSDPERFPTEAAQEAERQRLFRIIEDLVKWENSTSEQVLSKARAEILKATNGNPPPVLDPFCGGGSIPLEAQRLGLEVHASDLNPVAVLITKALIEIPPRFAGRPPVNPESRRKMDHSGAWQRAQGLAEDIRYYGKWMREEAERRIGHLYPKAKFSDGKDATVIAWLWARTVKCPNPACGSTMPLLRSFSLSTKKGNEVSIVPIIDSESKTVEFELERKKTAMSPLKAGRGARFRCLVCAQIADEQMVRSEFQAKRNALQLTAVAVEVSDRRDYLAPTQDQVALADSASPQWSPQEEMNQETSDLVSGRGYGIKFWRELFTKRQLAALTEFTDLVNEARQMIVRQAVEADLPAEGATFDQGGDGANAYADAITTYLALAASKATVFHNMFARWRAGENKSAPAFGRQALPMVWDFAEVNPFAGAGGDFYGVVNGIAAAVSSLPASPPGKTYQLDAMKTMPQVRPSLVCTDPPYYSNINYADLSDFFYVWLRHTARRIFPDLFSTVLVPKAQELIAASHRFGGDERAAREFFEQGISEAFVQMYGVQHKEFPLTIFYAFKQSETEEPDDGRVSGPVFASTGWETMLEALLKAGFSITGTWPNRTEGATRLIAMGTNSLASSVVLVCRLRQIDAPLATRREFLSALKRELPEALHQLQRGNIAPVDLAQAAIGPGMAVFSRYSKVVESDGSSMRVRVALQLINQALDEVLVEQETEYDPETRWAVAWYEQFGMTEGAYGTAETLSKAKNTSVSGMDESGITISRAGKVRLLRRDELLENWDPSSDSRLTVWEVAQYLIRSLETGGEAAAALLFKKVGGLAETARDLAYRLYTTSERKGWAQEGVAYNSLVVAWPEIKRLAGLPTLAATETLFDKAR